MEFMHIVQTMLEESIDSYNLLGIYWQLQSVETVSERCEWNLKWASAADGGDFADSCYSL